MNKTTTKIPSGNYSCYVRGVRVVYEPTIRIELSLEIGAGEYKDYFNDNEVPLFDHEEALSLSFSPLSYVDNNLFIRVIRMFEDGNPGFRFVSHESLLNKNIQVVFDGRIKKLLPVSNNHGQ